MLKNLKVVFMGTPDFSVPVLEKLIENCLVLLVVTQPDKEVGRKKELKFSPIKEVAIRNNIEVFQPENIKKDYQKILDLNPDIIITCAYGQFIPKEILDYPKFGCINVHASLLPSLRGGAPIHHAIIDGYKETGVTIMYMDIGMDSGDIISWEKTEITDSDTLESLHDRLSLLGSELLIKTLPSIIDGTCKRIKQDDTLVTFGMNIKREEELINFNKKKRDIYNQVRGLNPYPGSYFILDGKTIKVYKIETIESNKYLNRENGEIVELSKDGIYLKVKDGLIKLLEIQFEGKKRMMVRDFLNGNKEELIGKIGNQGVGNEEKEK